MKAEVRAECVETFYLYRAAIVSIQSLKSLTRRPQGLVKDLGGCISKSFKESIKNGKPNSNHTEGSEQRGNGLRVGEESE